MKTNDTPRTDAIISAIDMDAAFQDLCRDLERELTKMTKERNDALQAYIVLDASYKMLRQELANLRNALALGGPLNDKQQEYINLHETIHRT
jgi:hypothetical protein